MRVLAMVFGWMALAGTVFIGANWANANSEAKKATFGYQLAQASMESLNGLHASEQQLQDSIVRNLDQGIGGKEGAKKLRAAGEKNIADMRDTLTQLSEQQDIATSNRNSLAVYSDVVQRDITLAYVLGALWVAFGFAWALSTKVEKPVLSG